MVLGRWARGGPVSVGLGWLVANDCQRRRRAGSDTVPASKRVEGFGMRLVASTLETLTVFYMYWGSHNRVRLLTATDACWLLLALNDDALRVRLGG